MTFDIQRMAKSVSYSCYGLKTYRAHDNFAAVELHIYINLWTRLIYGFNIYSMVHVLRHQ